MARAAALVVAGNLALAALLLATLGSALGARLHHDLAYAALVIATLAAWRQLRTRRLATLLMASLGAWSLVTGLVLVYVTPDMGGGRAMRWWHGATSVGFALAFLAHWARNNPRLLGLARAAAGAPASRAGIAGAWALVALLGIASWTTALRRLFGDEHFRALTAVSFLFALFAVAYVGALARMTPLGARLAQHDPRNRLRGAIDLSLLGLTWIATLTGLALLYFTRDLRAIDAYWFAAAWHVLASALLTALVLAHATLNRRPLAAHLVRKL